MYSKQWSQFETQSLAFGILRKSLYPKYLVRGDHGEIKIYRPTANQYDPTHLLTIKVHASTTGENHKFEKLDDKTCLVVGGNECYKILDHVKEYLK